MLRPPTELSSTVDAAVHCVVVGGGHPPPPEPSSSLNHIQLTFQFSASITQASDQRLKLRSISKKEGSHLRKALLPLKAGNVWVPVLGLE